MYTQNSIDQILDAVQLQELIGRDVTLKKSGSGYKGLSPFTSEKSPSFMVAPSKGIWKCFSSGQGGGGRSAAYKYLELKHGMNFPDAMKLLSDITGIPLEEAAETDEDKRHRSDRVEMDKVLRAAYRKWHQALIKDWDTDGPISKYLKERGYTREEIGIWGIGYAPDKSDFLARPALDNGVLKYAEMAGIVNRKEEKTYDAMRHRITFEITDGNGRALGFSGRQAPGNDFGGKYVNTKATSLFDKSRIIYGLAHAREGILNHGFAMLMEGQTDVHACHRAELNNAVACMGTAVTPYHAKQLNYLCHSVLMVGDGDKAGREMVERSLPVLLKEGVEARCVFLPEGEDPDTMLKKDPKAFKELIAGYEDALINWAGHLLAEANSPNAKGQAITHIAAMVGNIPNKAVADQYVAELSRIYRKQGVAKTNLAREVKDHVEVIDTQKLESSQLNKLPDGVDHDFVATYSFYPITDRYNTGYYFIADGGGKSGRRASNFVLEPIFHRRAPNDHQEDARVIRINNGIETPKLVMMPSDALVSVEMFKKWCFRQGAYQWLGNAADLQKLVASILFQLPEAHEITTLGQQSEGFFAYQNVIYNGKLTPYDEFGLVKHNDMHFFSPGVSDIFKGVRLEDNKYKYDAFLTYMDSDMTLESWCQHMKGVYGDFGMPAIAFAFMSAFRDIVFEIDKNCPFLYIYGPRQSGKSKIAESIQAIFFYKRQMFQINSGTEFAFMTYMGRFRNTPSGFNEFDDKYLKGPKENWFQIIKGSYDGEGRMRGSGDKRNIEIQEVSSTIMLVGQYLSTRDDNSVVSRSVVLPYQKRDFSQDEMQRYNTLKEWENRGITNVSAQILKNRPAVKRAYRETIYKEMKTVQQLIKKRNEFGNDRVIRNYCALLSMWSIFLDIVKLPWTIDEFREWATDEIIMLSHVIETSDVLHEFWSQMESMVTQRLIVNGIHFKVKENVVTFKDSKGEDVVVPDGPTDLLYIRPKLIQPEYLKAMRSQGMDGLNQTTLMSYMQQRPYYLGQVSKERFGDEKGEVQTSAYVMDWRMLSETTDITLGIRLGEPEAITEPVEGEQDDLPF